MEEQRNKDDLVDTSNLWRILGDFQVKALVDLIQGREKGLCLLQADGADLSGLIIFCRPHQSQVKPVFSSNPPWQRQGIVATSEIRLGDGMQPVDLVCTSVPL